jgi:hypothetical protein
MRIAVTKLDIYWLKAINKTAQRKAAGLRRMMYMLRYLRQQPLANDISRWAWFTGRTAARRYSWHVCPLTPIP